MKPTKKCPYFDEESDDNCDHDYKYGCKFCAFDSESGEWYCTINAADGTEPWSDNRY